MIPYCAICEVCTPTLMVHIDCTWGVDVEKIPGEAAPCVCGTLERWNGDSCHFPARANWILYSTKHCPCIICHNVESRNVSKPSFKKASKHKSPHPRHVELVRCRGRRRKNWGKMASKSPKSLKFEASDHQWTPKENSLRSLIGKWMRCTMRVLPHACDPHHIHTIA